MVKWHQRWLRAVSSLWFIPGLIVFGLILLGLLLVEADSLVGARALARWPRIFNTSPDGARALLSAVAGSMITVAGVVFSITVVALALASSQFSARVLRNFMADHTNQTVLGIFLGIFAYCLVVVRPIHDGPESVPAFAVFVGILLALIAIGVLIYYIHHISTSIQVAHLLPAIAKETIEAIDELFPEGVGEEGFDDDRECEDPERQWFPVLATKTGYIQEIGTDDLLAFAVEHGTILRLEAGVGEFAIEGVPIASLLLKSPPPAGQVQFVQERFAIGRNRTIEQDAAFGIRQIVDIILKGLSAAINDPNTAVMAIHYLTAVLVRLARRHIESRYRSEEGELRLIVKENTFVDYLRLAYGEPRHYAMGHPSVLVALMESITTVARHTQSAYRAAALQKEAEAMGQAWCDSITLESDQEHLQRHYERMMQAIEAVTRK